MPSRPSSSWSFPTNRGVISQRGSRPSVVPRPSSRLDRPSGDRVIAPYRRERGGQPSILSNESPSSRGRVFRRPPTNSEDVLRSSGIRRPDSADSLRARSSPSNRGGIDLYRPGTGNAPRVPDVNSGRPGSEFRPPRPPAHGSSGYSHSYWRDSYRHYRRYADCWFGGAHSWRRFIYGCSSAPWFWSHYSYVYYWPWVFGYYYPTVYADYGWWTPRWYGQVYYPWWDWCDAPFVYYYYNYPARFAFHVSIGGGYDGDDYDIGYYGGDIYDGGASVVTATLDRPLGIWVPGHWEQRDYVDSEWVWVPGYYIY